MVYNQKGLLGAKEKANEYIPLVKKIANHIYKKVNFLYDINDLIQSGMVALLEVMQKPHGQFSRQEFEAYLTIRIKGGMLDELRKNDHLCQEDRKIYTKISEVSKKLKHLSNNQVNHLTDQSISNECQITLSRYYEVLHRNQYYDFLSMEDDVLMQEKVGEDSTFITNERSNLLKKVALIIGELNQKEQLVMQLTYVEECSVEEIAGILEVSKARVSQIHSTCIHKIRVSI